METLLQQLRIIAEAMRQGKPAERPFCSIHEFVLRYGKPFEYRPLPSNVRPDEPKHCYENSAKLAAVEGWIYVEGFGTVRGTGLAISHAWVCKPGTNIVIDPTTNNITHYFGVPFKHEVLRHHWKHNYSESASMIDDWHNDWPMLHKSVEQVRMMIADIPEAPAITA